MLPTTTDDVIEEVSKCPENESLNVSKKIMIYVAMTRFMVMQNILRLQENTITIACNLLLNTQNQLTKSRNNCRETCTCKSKNSFHQIKNICVFKKMGKVLMLHSVQNRVC